MMKGARTPRERIVTCNRVIFRPLLMAISLLCLCAGVTCAAETRLEASLAEGGVARLTLAGKPVKAMTEVPFAVQLFDAKGEAIRGASIALSLTMPFMPMPPNHPRAEWDGTSYSGRAIFTMAGAWQVQATITRTGRPDQVARFDIEMVVMQ